ncbi:MAG: amidohydrolase family protein [Desulfitobacteriaceae bacterium]
MDLIIRQAKLKDVLVDVGVEKGKIITIVPRLNASAPQEINAEGSLLSAPFVDPHLHLDAVLTAGEPDWNHTGTLLEGIALWNRRKSSLSYADVKTRARKAVFWEVAQGVQHIRTHVDVCDPNLTALQALVDLREEMKEIADIQIVAFPQEGIPSYPNGKNLMTEAMERGCDVVGGIPHYEITRDYGIESLDFVVALARK